MTNGRTPRDEDLTSSPAGKRELEAAPTPTASDKRRAFDWFDDGDTLRPPPAQSGEFLIPAPPRLPAEWAGAHTFEAALITGVRSRRKPVEPRRELAVDRSPAKAVPIMPRSRLSR